MSNFFKNSSFSLAILAAAAVGGLTACQTFAPVQTAGMADNVTMAPGTQAFIVVDQESGYILDQRRGNESRPIAGLAHMATAMVAIDWMQATGISSATLAPVSANVVAMNMPNPLQLRPGDSMSLRDYLYAILMNSDATAAYALAEYVGSRMAAGGVGGGYGGMDLFVNQMNAMAQQHGMTRTRFTNAHGYDALGSPNTSSAADLARLASYAIGKPAFQFKVSQPSRPITVMRQGTQSQTYTLRNTNELLGRSNIDGVKTGLSQAAGGCLVASAEQPPKTWQEGEVLYRIDRRLIVVTLGSVDRFQDGLSLFNYGWNVHNQWLSQNRPMEAGRSIKPPTVASTPTR